MKVLLLITVSIVCVSVSVADNHRPGKYLDHDRTVVNCAKYKREANQHSCVLSPFNTEGPYFLPDDLQRSDITDGQVGIPLNLKINLVNANDCNPLQNMYVHVWQTNSLGIYSAVANEGQDGNPVMTPAGELGTLESVSHGGPGDSGMGPNGGRPTPLSDERYLRGYQVTNANGQVTFSSIIPGWYTGRCLHIHIEVYPLNSTERKNILYVGQLFFHRELPNKLSLIEPYSSNPQPILLNEDDKHYRNFGNETILELITKESSYSSEITLGINPDALKLTQ